MSVVLEVDHLTRYRYAKPVAFGEHRLMFRPRAGHDIQVIDATVKVNVDARIDWLLDTQSNSVTLIAPQASADELTIECWFKLAHHDVRTAPGLPLAAHAQKWPFDYSDDERRDLGATLDPHYPDPEGRLHEWMWPLVSSQGRPGTLDLLLAMMHAIKNGFTYETRDDEGTQTPDETLKRGSGSCRDFALLQMEAVRRLGMAARFVSGYLYDPALDGETSSSVVGAGSTHAWLHVYLPGAGWVDFDPTNSSYARAGLIQVAVARDPRFAAPLAGSWFGNPADYRGMEVKVDVRRVDS